MKNTKIDNLIIIFSIIVILVFGIFSISTYLTYGKSFFLIMQSILGFFIFAFILFYGIKIKSIKEKRKIHKTKAIETKKEIDITKLNKEEKEIIKILKKEKEILQSKLMQKINVNKVKMTRLLKKLEEKNLIFKKKAGMNNVVVLN